MRKEIMLISLIIMSIGFASASTLVLGKIYDNNFVGVEGADITVACNYSNNINYRYDVTSEDGSYSVTYKETGSDGCKGGDNVVVTVVKGELSNVGYGVVEGDMIPTLKLDIAIVNIVMTPEFGFYFGLITLVCAVGVFFVVKK